MLKNNKYLSIETIGSSKHFTTSTEQRNSSKFHVGLRKLFESFKNNNKNSLIST